jgi:predicted SnoaL-like aldol condensation-catalyzing enzyme
MRQMNFRGVCFAASAALVLMVSGGAVAQQLDPKAQFCDDFDQNVIFGGKIDEASKYLTDDFKEHNAGLLANSLAEFKEKFGAFRAAMAGRGGGGRGRGGRGGPAPERTVLTQGDVVVFITLTRAHPDPNDASKTIPQTSHFDVFKLRGGKIAEHWD